MKAKVIAALLTGAAMLIAVPTWAGVVDFQFANCSEITSGAACANVDSGATSITYKDTAGDAAPLLKTFGTDPGDATTDDLYVKLTSGDPLNTESGLGFTSEASHEIDTTSFIQMDVSTLIAAGFTMGTVTVNSTSGDSFKICMSASAGVLGSCSGTFSGPGDSVSESVTFSSANPFVGVEAVTGNVLLTRDFQATTATPEPGSLLLFGSGLLGLGSFLRRRFKA